MKQPVRIHMKSLQRDRDGEEHQFDMEVEGVCYRKQGHFYYQYEEPLAEHGGTSGLLRVEQEKVGLIRNGGMRMHMIYQRNRRQETILELPEGQIPISIYTHTLRTDIDDRGLGRVEIGYDTAFGGTWVYYHQIQFTIQEDLACR